MGNENAKLKIQYMFEEVLNSKNYIEFQEIFEN